MSRVSWSAGVIMEASSPMHGEVLPGELHPLCPCQILQNNQGRIPTATLHPSIAREFDEHIRSTRMQESEEIHGDGGSSVVDHGGSHPLYGTGRHSFHACRGRPYLGEYVGTSNGASGGRHSFGEHNSTDNDRGRIPGGSGGDPAALHPSATNNEEVRITIDNIVDEGSSTHGREAALGNANELRRRGHMQEDKATKLVLALFFAAASTSWEAYPVIEKALGPKLAPFAYGAIWVPVGLLGAGAFAALVFDKSPKPCRVFVKYAILLSIVATVALGFLVLFSLIFG